MLLELTVENFAIIERVHLRFQPGLNVLTGETGAGKSILVDAMSLLLGARALSEYVRAGAHQARVEGLFLVNEPRADALRPLLEDHGVIEADEPLETLILTREIRARGANVCRINGRAVPLRLLQEVGERLIHIHGQGEHMALRRPAAQLNLLDRYAGTQPLRARLANRVSELRKVRAAMRRLAVDQEALEQRAERLRFTLQEIEEAGLHPGEEEALREERRLRINAERLAELAQEAYALLYGGGEDHEPALDHIGRALRALHHLAKLDARLEPHVASVEQALVLLDDVARFLGDYVETIEHDPARLQEIEQRLDLIFRLKRKYGPTVEDVLRAAADARAELERTARAQERLAQLRHLEARLLEQIGQLGVALSARRRQAAARLSEAVARELAHLRMGQTRLMIHFTWQQDSTGAPVNEAFGLDPSARYAFDTTGLDRVEFLISTNPGEPPKPLARVASGGEMARFMLALQTILGEADETPVLIFDEVDTGMGGRLGTTVGRKLHALGRLHQVLCITHLPQLAAFGDAHFRVYKVQSNDRTVTRVEPLDEEGRLRELASMLGTGHSAREAAEELRRQGKAGQEL
ncbi:MAG: DNA repair protein RecN [Ardenticatenia bacterium]|nr:DNA repair protein RecN [Ardenticatenia bacterium]